MSPVKEEQGTFGIERKGYYLLLECSVLRVWPGPILFKGPIQTAALNPHEPCLHVAVSSVKALEFPRTQMKERHRPEKISESGDLF